MAGTCYLKGVLQQPNSDQRDLGHFTAGWKGGQNIFIDKGKVVFIFKVFHHIYRFNLPWGISEYTHICHMVQGI